VPVRILDLYSGMGGLSLGFSLALDGAEILGLDIDGRAVATYNRNLNRFGARAEAQDVLEWEPRGEFDVVMGGVPCQPYSIANSRRRGVEHPLYPTLPRFFDVILALKPKVFLMENVKGLTSRRHRPLLEQELARVRGEYVLDYRVLNAAFYGVPQRRERLFVLGIRRDLGVSPGFPEPTHAPEERIDLAGRRIHRWVTVEEAIGDLLSAPPLDYPKKLVQTNPRHGKPIDLGEPSRTVKVDGRGGDFTFDTMLVPLVLDPRQVERIRNERENTSRHRAKMEFPDPLDRPSRTVSSHTVEGTKRETIVLPVMVVRAGRDDVRPCDGAPSYTIANIGAGGPRQGRPLVLDGGKYRRLTVREALRLQSFPDWWGFPEGVKVSVAYKLTGEAVSPALAYRLAIHIGRLFGWKTREPPRFEDWQLPYFYRMFADYYSNEVRL